MATINIIKDKPATANNSFVPFLPSLAVNEIINKPANRWLGNIIPAWLSVDLQGSYFVNRWNAKFMGFVGWQNNYNIRDFKLQGSSDNISWFDMDVIANNSANAIDRAIPAKIARYLRVYITRGPAINSQIASIVDFEAFEPDNVALLSKLVPSLGTLSPVFSPRCLEYTMSVNKSVSSIAFTPTTDQQNVSIAVGGKTVKSGEQSPQIALSGGVNKILVEAWIDSKLTMTYLVTVNKEIEYHYLSNLVVKNNRGLDILLTPLFKPEILNYSFTISSAIPYFTIAPYVADTPGIIIKVNGVVVKSGDSIRFEMTPGTTNIPIEVSKDGGYPTKYSVTATKS